ncbi:hypothetical protein QR98_0002040 [Sarcoptes scabiei]|uniref:Uncharacterized protein n=1 Tax=Sarcoptes scabiei TaxID=52283 RepID=A0A131ZSZ5_SARSC|nr:hypothetical protein QR98_0002040 [Sarcoptes scabiei]
MSYKFLIFTLVLIAFLSIEFAEVPVQARRSWRWRPGHRFPGGIIRRPGYGGRWGIGWGPRRPWFG